MRRQGLTWLAVGLEPETYESPMVIECLKKVNAGEVKPAEEKPEVKPAEKPEVKPAEMNAGEAKPEVKPPEVKPAGKLAEVKPEEKPAEKPVEETPTKRRKKREALPRLQDFIPQVPGPLQGLAPVDPKDF